MANVAATAPVITLTTRQGIGGNRVSSFDQNPERQLQGVEVARVFTDEASGKDTQHPELERLLAFVREGDTMVVPARIRRWRI